MTGNSTMKQWQTNLIDTHELNAIAYVLMVFVLTVVITGFYHVETPRISA